MPEERFQCLREAIRAHGNNAKIDAWYRRWCPTYYAEHGLPTTSQYSLSCFLMDKASELIGDDRG